MRCDADKAPENLRARPVRRRTYVRARVRPTPSASELRERRAVRSRTLSGFVAIRIAEKV